jgi:hypothetical protein
MQVSRPQAVRAVGAAIAAALLLTGCAQPEADPQERTLALIRSWVAGNYNNLGQFENDMAMVREPEQMHRPMHQLFAPVEARGIDGYVVFQQSSMDGSENPAMIFRHGLIQYFPDPDSDAVIQRELYFKEPEAFKNLHRNPELLADVTLDDMTWDAGCDFYLRANEAGDMVSGPILPRACVLFNEGLQQKMYADDRVEITPTHYRFKGVYVDEAGNVVWGTESAKLNSLAKVND